MKIEFHDYFGDINQILNTTEKIKFIKSRKATKKEMHLLAKTEATEHALEMTKLSEKCKMETSENEIIDFYKDCYRDTIQENLPVYIVETSIGLRLGVQILYDFYQTKPNKLIVNFDVQRFIINKNDIVTLYTPEIESKQIAISEED